MRVVLISLIAGFSVLIASCLKSNLVEPTAKQSSSSLAIGLSMRDAPSNVGSIVGILSREGNDTLKSNFTVSVDSAVCQFDNVATGTWHLQVDAFDQSSSLKYSGNTDVQVLPDQTTPVRLTLDTTSGSIYTTVTWGTQDTISTDMALEFGGTNGRVDFSPSPELRPKFMTAEMAVLFDTLSVFQPILVEGVSNVWNQASGFEITYENGYLYFEVAQSPIYRVGPRYSYIPPLHRWIHIASTFDGDTIKIYVEGELVAQQADTTQAYYAGSVGFSTGYAYNSYYGGPSYFKGGMDELRIWNYARTQSEIDSSMNSRLTGNEPGLVGYWDFNQNTSDTYALDRTGNGNNGQLVGGVHFVPASSLVTVTGIDRLHR